MRTIALIPLCLAVASAFMPPPPSVRTRVVTTSLMAPHMGSSRPIFQTGHGGGIIMGGGDGDDGDNTGGNGGGNGGGSGDSGKGGDNPLMMFWKGYNDLLDKQPILTKALTSFVGFSLGDLLAQKFLDKAEQVDMKRLLKLASFGLLIHGPTGHFFYGFLDGKIPGTDALSVASKVGIDQLLWNPIFGCMFFGYLGLCEGQDFNGIKTKIQNDLVTAVKGSWTVWPIAHAINFRFIPNSQRLLYINTVQVGYNMFLSMLAKKSAAEPAAAK